MKTAWFDSCLDVWCWRTTNLNPGGVDIHRQSIYLAKLSSRFLNWTLLSQVLISYSWGFPVELKRDCVPLKEFFSLWLTCSLKGGKTSSSFWLAWIMDPSCLNASDKGMFMITDYVLTCLTGCCYCLLCAFLWIFLDICLFECCVSYYCVRHGMDDILVCLLRIDATRIQSNMRVFVSTFDC